MKYQKPRLQNLTQEKIPVLTQYSFLLDYSQCDGSDNERVVNNTDVTCADPSDYDDILNEPLIELTCHGDPNTYRLVIEDIAQGGTVDDCDEGDVSTITTFSFPDGAPEDPCIVESLIGFDGDQCE